MDSTNHGSPNGRPSGQGGNRNRNRSKSRNRSRESGGDREASTSDSSARSGGRANSYRSRDKRSFPRKAPQPSLLQRLLSTLSFGLLGKSSASRPAKAKNKPGGARQSAPAPAPPREPRKPVCVEVTGPRLYVGNLDYQAHEDDLEELFRGVGKVARAEIVTNPRTQQSKGFGFVEMGHIDEARRAVEVLHDQEFMGRKLLVTGAKSSDEGSDEEVASSPGSAAA